jgi:3-phosphoshikimate 1-carboxyvinyltransferase
MSQAAAFIDLPAVHAARGTVRVPGSKSISIRALLLAALADGETVLDGVLRSADTTVMIDALRALGVPIDDRADGSLVVHGAQAFPARRADVFVGNSGLSIRTLTATLAFAGGHYRLAGIARMHERPIGDLVDALRTIGARIVCEAREGYPPLTIEPAVPSAPADDAHANTRTVTVSGSASSQFVTGLLQSAPLHAASADISIDVVGALISRPYVDLTIAMMKVFGVDVREEPAGRFVVARGAAYASPGRFAIEGDASSASYLLAAGLLGGGPVRVEGIGRASLQGDARFVDVLIAMGAEVLQEDEATEVRSPGVRVDSHGGFRLRAIDADFNHIPDAAMTVAVLALFADGPCTLRNIASWRVKETDRIAAMAAELAKFGATVEAGHDWLRIEPLSKAAVARLAEHALRGEPIAVATYDDHRIAMCFSLVTFLGIPVRIEDPDCVAKTFPDYFERFAALVRSADHALPVHLVA